MSYENNQDRIIGVIFKHGNKNDILAVDSTGNPRVDCDLCVFRPGGIECMYNLCDCSMRKDKKDVYYMYNNDYVDYGE